MRKLTAPSALVAVAAMMAIAAPAGASVHPNHAVQATHTRAGIIQPDGALPEPDITMQKSANVQSFSGANQTITYSYTVTNDGGYQLTNATVTDPMTGLSAINCGSSSPVIASLAPQASVTCTATYVTTGSDVAARDIYNAANVTASYGSGSVQWSTYLDIPLVGTPFTCPSSTYFLAQEPDSGNATTMYGTTTSFASNSYTAFAGSAYSGGYNAIGYDTAAPGVNYIYGIDGSNNLVQIASDGVVSNVGTIFSRPAGFPVAPSVGAFDGAGDYYVTNGGGSSTMYTLSIDASGDATVTSATHLSQPFGAYDWTYWDNYLWGLDGTTLYQVSPGGVVSTHTLGFIAPADQSTFGAAWTYGDGSLGFSNNVTGEIYRIRVANPTSGNPSIGLLVRYQGPQQAALNDGTSCVGQSGNTNLTTQTTGTTTAAAKAEIGLNVKVINHGPGISSGFALTDTTTAGLTDLKTSSPGCTVDTKTRTVQCDEGVMTSGDEFTIALTGKASGTVGKCFTSTATLDPNEADPVPSDDTSSIRTCTVNPAATWTSSPGGAVSAKSGKVTLADASTGTGLTCKTSAAAGTLESGTGLAGASLGMIKSMSLTGCTGPGGLAFKIIPAALPWALNAVSYAGGVTNATLIGMDATLTAAGCTATLDGTAAGADNGQVSVSYTNSTGKLSVLGTDGNLTVSKVSGCSGLLGNGDTVTLGGAYTLSPKQVMTSP